MKVSKDISQTLARVRESAAKLNQLCDQAAESVRTLEEFLAKECSAGIEAHVEVSHDRDEYHEGSLYLCYDRWGNRFRVLLRWYDSSDPGPGQTTAKPWAECKRDEKLSTVAFLADLITAIDENLDSQIKRAQAAISGIANLTSSARKNGGANGEN
jgi:hypothetical protein